ncbi:ParB/Srx family N-terminal domain-containing protein [Roseovarius sp. CAU 1744]|uniref:ParB/RepB/Spo0J family partition protein n=1 Tax=Roseovarius sp. CAU 1744 TaxID=3140368 RepID=UPI00325A555A
MTKQTNITTDGAIIHATLDQLYLHDLNPRQDVSDAEIETLTQSIKICGLLQNLSGLRDDQGKIGIVAGGRRLRALMHLSTSDPDHVALAAIPVRLASDARQAEMWANAENTARADLDSADEIRAYGRMAEGEASAETIASAFGVTVAHVKGRLKLANLPDSALHALKARKINLTSAKKMTTTNDETLILKALQLIEDGHIDTTRQLDHFLHPKAATGTDRRAVFVGAEVYEAAGGKITRDLFSEDVFFEDSDILGEVFETQLAEKAEVIRAEQGWAWVETHDESYLGWHFLEERKFERVYPVAGVLSDDQSERYDALAELAEGDVLDVTGQAEFETLQKVLDGDFTADQKQVAGCVAYVRSDGTIDLCAGLIRPEDKTAAIEAGILAKSNHAAAAAPKNPYSQKLRDDLDAIKLAALQNAMLDQPELLLDLLGFQLCGMTGYEKVFDVSLGEPTNAPITETGFAVDKRLSKPRHAPKDAWNVDLPKAFTAFRKKGRKFRDAEITRQLARVLTGMGEDFSQLLAEKSASHIRQVWTPTAENFFKRISGPMLEDIYAELLDVQSTDDRARRFAKLKKGEKAEVMEALFSDPARRKALGLTPEQDARLENWVPDHYV